MASIKDIKDKRIKIFHIETSGDISETETNKVYNLDELGEVKVYNASYKSLSGQQFYASNARNEQVDCLFKINFTKDKIEKDYYIEDISSGKTYLITFKDNYEGYIDDLKLYATQKEYTV